MKWTDSTSYTQGAPRIQSAWSLELPSNSHLRVVVMNAHRYYPGHWAMFVMPFHREAVEMKAKTLEEAQLEALEFARLQVVRMSAALNGDSQ